MKRFLTLCMAACLLLSLLCGAQAEALEGDWFELSAEDTVLTVRLPGDEANGYAWNAEFSKELHHSHDYTRCLADFFRPPYFPTPETYKGVNIARKPTKLHSRKKA